MEELRILVKFHVNAILGKLGAQSRATRLGLIIL